MHRSDGMDCLFQEMKGGWFDWEVVGNGLVVNMQKTGTRSYKVLWLEV